MRKIVLSISLLFAFALNGALSFPAIAATSASSAAKQAPVALTPEQARTALAVLNDPARRSQIEDTLRAVAAAGALAVPISASDAAAASGATAASDASAASGASGAAGVLAKSLTSNGLASQITHQASSWMVEISTGLRRSVTALLDYGSVIQWWRQRTATESGRALVGEVFWAILVSLLPALLLEYLSARLVRGQRARIAARGIVDVDDTQPELKKDERAAVHAEAVAERSGNEVAIQIAEQKADTARGVRHAARHWTLLQRLPSAILHSLLALLPLVVFTIAATVLMSIFIDEGTPQGRSVAALVDVYLICRGIVIASGFFFAPRAPGLRLIQMSDESAAFTHHWLVAIVSVAGAGIALAEGAAPLGLTNVAHDSIIKAVALVVHVLIAIVILKCRVTVAQWIRDSMRGRRPFVLFGNWIADMWAVAAVFLVMALWFVWALDVHNGYRTLFHLFGVSLLVLVAARVIAIVVFGALGHMFHTAAEEEDLATKSIAHRHAYRYYPLLRRVLQTLIIIGLVLTLLQVWGLHVFSLFSSGGVGHRLASALITIAVAALFAVIVWEGANVLVEQRLERWTASGDRLRAARLQTLLPMMRTALFIVIAMVVVMTGLSEIGVNTGPLLASASIFGVALGFGSQKLVQDLITGIFLLMENAMQVGDSVTLAGVSGTVEYLSIRTVRLRGGDGSLFTVPFSSVSTVNNTNRGIGNAAVRVSIALGQDIGLASDTLKEIGASLREDDAFKDGILSDFSLWGVDAVDGSTVTLAGQIQCRDTARWGVQREFNRRIVDRFTQAGIEIANPQRNFLIFNSADGEELAARSKGSEEGELLNAPAQAQATDSAGRDPYNDAAVDSEADQSTLRGARTSTGEPSNSPPDRSKPSRS
ncbi:mechanosensitive ion channel domain-containing protein [Burkholderia sp. PAMC 26561]|uniref:Potassium efflux system KefA protein / Small-conductance mechanosensitive channel n=1 Tax=Caballeronia sordidicola TaxID=196367 RepID=A0A242N4V0_CABSO|nr:MULTISPECIES: mechanosensitive ion channel domain-containing protein [Burkholderiaceae]AME26383.1 mechanosensitive ion channel protein [Burkholderia sp. PAMC 26561]OTP78700.1 Potassium efflux system KefA protein / Small-conductance mechanosensitive channel [Caballeronia sordidicola]